MLLKNALAIFLSVLPTTIYAETVSSIYTFPVNTAVENLFVRASGQVLANLVTVPEIYHIDPAQESNTTLIHHFDGYTALLGITEVELDQFYVAAGNFNTVTLITEPGSFSIWHIDMSAFNDGGEPVVEKVVDVVDADMINGLGVISQEDGLIYGADAFQGIFYAINVYTGEYYPAISNELTIKGPPMADVPAAHGCAAYNGYAYFTNTAQGLVGRVPINANGTEAGAAEIVTSGYLFDDLRLDYQGSAYVAVYGSDVVAHINLETGDYTMLGNNTGLQAPTSVSLGRGDSEANSIFVSLNGGLGRATVIGGGIRRIDL